eukprot:1527394-Heterocapsa_arctica.AAC.1
MGPNVAKPTKAAKAKEKARVATAAAKQNTAARSKLIIEQSAADEATESKRKLKKRDSEQQVKKILYDHFKTLSDEEVYLHEFEGKSLHERLLDDRRAWKKGELDMGQKYYAKLRSEYANPCEIDSKLKPTNPADEQDDALAAALLQAVISGKNSVQQYVDWSETVPKVNNFNLIAVYRQAVKMPPF